MVALLPDASAVIPGTYDHVQRELWKHHLGFVASLLSACRCLAVEVLTSVPPMSRFRSFSSFFFDGSMIHIYQHTSGTLVI